MQYHPDGKSIFIGQEDGVIKQWNLKTNTNIGDINSSEG